MDKAAKTLNLLSAADRFERIRNLIEIRLNGLLFRRTPPNGNVQTFAEFRAQTPCGDAGLYDLLKPGGEAEEAVRAVRAHFEELGREHPQLPFPTVYNADPSLALLCYGLTRWLKPEVVVETGVCYGTSSSLILLALARNRSGRLISIDLPPLSDPAGIYTGILVSEDLRERWTLRLGSSRRWLPRVLKEVKNVGLFFADDATVYTLQRYEFETAWPLLSRGGVALIDDVSGRFQRFLGSVDQTRCYYISQMEKPCVTALVLKK